MNDSVKSIVTRHQDIYIKIKNRFKVGASYKKNEYNYAIEMIYTHNKF